MFWTAGSYLAGYFKTAIDPKEVFDIGKRDTENSISAPIESPLPYADIQSGAVISSSVKLCSNMTYGFEVSYPNDWFTTYNTEDQKCLFFAPYSFVVPQDTHDSFVPIKIEAVNPDDWPGVVKFYENPNDFQNVISNKNIEINGQSIRQIEAVLTGFGEGAKGLVKLTYLVFNSKTPIAFVYEQTNGDENAEKNKRILEDIVRSLRYF